MKTKKVYELCYQTEDQEWHNLLFSSKKKAEDDQENDYRIGEFTHGKKIINNIVVSRTLF